MTNQRQYYGRGSIKKLESILLNEKANNILFVVGKSSFIKSGAKSCLQEIFKKFNCLFYKDFEPNPELSDIERGVGFLSHKKCSHIVAIGGGSALDVAKSISLLQANKGYEKEVLLGQRKAQSPDIPLIAIPTTSGSGSESTHFSVVYYKGKKYSLAHQNLLPKFAILDPNLTDNLNQYITSYTAFDALSQAIESFWSVNATKDSRIFARDAMKILFPLLPLRKERLGSKMRELLMIGANLAGKAINISKTTAPHAFSYHLTSKYKIPHGHAVALMLGIFLNYNTEEGASHDKNYLRYLGDLGVIFEVMDVSNGLEAKERWYTLMEQSGLDTDPSKLHINQEDLVSNLLLNVNLQRLSNFPILLKTEHTKEAIKEALNLN